MIPDPDVNESSLPVPGDVAGPQLWLLGGLIAAIGFLFAVQRVPREIALIVVVAAGLMAYSLMASSGRRVAQASGGLSIPKACALIAGTGAALGGALALSNAGGTERALIVVTSALLVGLTAFAPDAWRVGFLTPAFVLIMTGFGLTVWYLKTHPTGIDVEVVLREGVQGFLQGHNPYELTFTNPYTPEESGQFFSPGILVDNRISIGFPYPPIVLLLAVPGYLLGDVRISGLLGLTLIAVLAHGRGHSKEGRAASLAFAFAPGALYLVSNAWTEMLSLTLVMSAVVAARSRFWTTATVLLAAFLASKQYLVVALPCLWLLRDYATRRRLLLLAGTAALLLIPWAIANPVAYWRALSGGHTGELVRLDSISLLVQGVVAFGWDSPTLFKWLPLLLGLAVGMTAALAWKPTVRSFLVATSLSVMGAVLFSKQSFVNYYFLVGMVMAMGAFAGPDRFRRKAHGLSAINAEPHRADQRLGSIPEPSP